MYMCKIIYYDVVIIVIMFVFLHYDNQNRETNKILKL